MPGCRRHLSGAKRLHWRPPLIELGRSVKEALAGPKHFTSRYVGVTPAVREAAASRMPGRHGAVLIPPAREGNRQTIATRWEALFQEVLRERAPSPQARTFATFLQGGFECSAQKRRDGRRLDLLAAAGHDAHAAADYRQLRTHGIATVRDGLRWHLIEPSDGRFDWASVLPTLRAAHRTGTEVIWDLMHYGWPDDIDIWSADFVRRFARYAARVAQVVRSETSEPPFYCPINEMSFLAWGGGESAYLNPFARGRSFELKAQLAHAAIEAMNAILAIEPRARFVHCEPVINIVPGLGCGAMRLGAEQARLAQFQAFDMISGALLPHLGGEPRFLDIVGVNYYRQNQWMLHGPSIDGRHPHYRPFRSLLTEVFARYGCPVLVSETGTEGPARAAWFAMIVRKVAAAQRAGVPVEGICLYPVIDHVGWDNDRDCPSGLLANRLDGGRRPSGCAETLPDVAGLGSRRLALAWRDTIQHRATSGLTE